MDNKLKTLSEGVAALSQVEVWLRPACPLTDVYIERPKKKAPKPAMISKRKREKKEPVFCQLMLLRLHIFFLFL